MSISDRTIGTFRQMIWNFYKKHKRILPWREKTTPYHVFISEVMLQQTQVARVMTKFPEFIKEFPDFATLSKASGKEVLRVWQGMGYNRRALYLRNAADRIVQYFHGVLPTDLHILETIPGIGKATARSIMVFSTNKPAVFIETNIRRTFIHNFFQDRSHISDSAIMPLVEQTLDQKNPREWYYALMDYGSMLPKQTVNPNRRSKHYIKQTKFKNSDRQIRGNLLRILLKKPSTVAKLSKQSGFPEKRIKYNLYNLTKEGFIMERQGKYSIK